MNSKETHATSSGDPLTLPEPDPDNITVLTRNLPNSPILPWNHYDSPWREAETEDSDGDESTDERDEVTDEPAAKNSEGIESADEMGEVADEPTTFLERSPEVTLPDELHQLG